MTKAELIDAIKAELGDAVTKETIKKGEYCIKNDILLCSF